MIEWRLAVFTTAWVAGLSFLLTSCSASGGPDPAALEASAAARILTIPPTSPEKYRGTIDKNGWHNPYLIIKTGGVALLDPDDHEERLLQPHELTQVLGNLPSSAWPYGRVVAVTENGVRAPGDDVPIRKNRALVAGTLQGLHVLIHWIPPPKVEPGTKP
jgi:hypothetical protein